MTSVIAELPVLGVGASLSLSTQPDPVALVQAEQGPAFVEYAGLVDIDVIAAEVARIRETGTAVLYHPSYINFCGSWPNSAAWLQATARHIDAVQSPWFAQDCAYCFWQQGPGYSSQLGYFVPPILNQQSLALAVERIDEVMDRVPVPVAIEPPPVSFVVGSMPVLEFFGELARRTGCALLLDMGHLVSYQMATGQNVLQGLDTFPVERVIEVHVAGGRLQAAESGPVYVDAHEYPVLDETWQMLDAVLPALPNVKAVCYECEGVDEQAVLDNLQVLRRHVREHAANRELSVSA